MQPRLFSRWREHIEVLLSAHRSSLHISRFLAHEIRDRVHTEGCGRSYCLVHAALVGSGPKLVEGALICEPGVLLLERGACLLSLSLYELKNRSVFFIGIDFEYFRQIRLLFAFHCVCAAEADHFHTATSRACNHCRLWCLQLSVR